MPLVGTAAFAELWAKAKNGFAKKISVLHDYPTSATIKLMNNAEDHLCQAQILAATTSYAGLMSSIDKAKLDGIATGATKTTVDSALSTTSTNPVQNKAVAAALDGKAASSHTHDASDVTGLPTKLPNPGALTMQLGGTTSKTYDGSSDVTFDVPAMGAPLSGITVYPTSTTTPGTALGKVACHATQCSHGGNLSLSGGAVKCAVAGVVRVSAQIYIVNGLTAGDVLYIQASRNTSSTWTSSNAVTYNSVAAAKTWQTLFLPGALVHVDAGDHIILGARNNTAARGTVQGTNATFLTVEYVSYD